MTLDLKQLFDKHSVKDLSTNSKTLNKDDAFFVLKGENINSSNFIREALDKGAALVITGNIKNTAIEPNKVIYVENVQAILHEAIEIFYPNMPQTMIAVTGTNGKSSVVSYIAQLYSLLGERAASIGTIGVEVFGSNKFNYTVPELTTFDYLTFRKTAHNLANNGINYLAFEASSHGLDQGRLGQIKVDIACFTSFSQDHLDYHHTEENYLLAKLKLFTDHLSQIGIAVFNSEIKIKGLLDKQKIKYISVGKDGELRITKIIGSLKGQNISFTFNDKKYNFNTNIIGSFQASNLLIAALSVNHTGFNFDKVINALTKVKPVKGRMERIENTNIFVDYAHTPDALEKALIELKNIKLQNSNLSVIFGCGGNRDTTKRSLMGRIASELADNVIITDDNPRNEDPQLIRQEIISGTNKANYIEIADREEAIKYGISNLKQDDILLIAGKGHESYQITGNKKIAFNDVEISKKYLSIKGT